jgi:uncharacterized protein (DUF488 family)
MMMNIFIHRATNINYFLYICGMKNTPMYTIGYGNRNPENFLFLLKEFSIEYLVDIRTIPHSKFAPQFNQQELKILLKSQGVTYVFMGDLIGGIPRDPSCYNVEGKVDYEVLKTKDFFLQGIRRLKIAHDKGISIVLMCSESKPSECHRSKLIGQLLKKENIILMHIDEKGHLKDQIKVMNELNNGFSETDLFGKPLYSTSRKVYM